MSFKINTASSNLAMSTSSTVEKTLEDGSSKQSLPQSCIKSTPTIMKSSFGVFVLITFWSSNMDGGIANVDNIFVPINVDNIYWLFLHVYFREKAIRLYNSLGSNTPRHRKYLLSMRK